MKKLLFLIFLFSTAYGQIITNKGVITNPVPIANGGTNNGSLSVTSGTMYVADGTKLVGIAPGTSSQILHGGTTPLWQDTTAISASTGWGILGNTGTSRSTNFMGSTDNVAVSFRQNNVFRMQLDTNGRSNLFIGNRPGIVWTGKVNLLIWDTSRIDPAFNGQTGGIEVVKEVYKISGDATLDGYINGIASETRIGGANTANWTDALQGQVSFYASNNIQIGATGTITRIVEYLAGADVGGMATSNRYGLLVNNPSLHNGATMTRNYPIYIANQTSTAVINYGLYSATDNNIIAPASALRASAGGLAVNALQVIATQPASPGGGSQYGVDFSITSAGSASEFNGGLRVNYLSGYTGSVLTLGIYGANSAAGTGTSITGTSHNVGGFFQNTSSTTGTNIGSSNWASNGNISIGVVGQAITTKNSGKNVGVMGLGINAGTTPFEMGGAFYLMGSDPTINISTALLADNGTEAQNILTLRDAGTTVIAVNDGGAMAIGAATATDKLEVTGNIALMAAGNKIKITEGTNGSVGQTTLVAGTKAITITGLATSSRALIQLVTPSGVTLTTAYQAVCTANTLTIQANVAAGTINTADVSVLNYFIIN